MYIAYAIAMDDIPTCMPCEGSLRLDCDSDYDSASLYAHLAGLLCHDPAMQCHAHDKIMQLQLANGLPAATYAANNCTAASSSGSTPNVSHSLVGDTE